MSRLCFFIGGGNVETRHALSQKEGMPCLYGQHMPCLKKRIWAGVFLLWRGRQGMETRHALSLQHVCHENNTQRAVPIRGDTALILFASLTCYLASSPSRSRYSAICTALRAAPLRIWSLTHQKASPLGLERSCRMRPTCTGSLPERNSGMG